MPTKESTIANYTLRLTLGSLAFCNDEYLKSEKRLEILSPNYEERQAVFASANSESFLEISLSDTYKG